MPGVRLDDKRKKFMKSEQSLIHISVIIPAYNAVQYLEATLTSLHNQKHVTEILLIDDCSKDGTLPLMQFFASQDPRIKVLHNETNKGVSYSRNKAINAACGNWLLFLDADDIAHPELTEKLVTKLLSLQADYPEQCWHLVYPSYQQIDQSGALISNVMRGKQLLQSEAFGYEIIRNLIISPSGVLVNKQEVINTGGFPVDRQVSEDWFLWLLLAKKSAFGYVDEPLMMIRRHPANTTDQVSKSRTAEIEVLRSFDIEYIKQAILRRPESEAQSIADIAAILQRLGFWSDASKLLAELADNEQTDDGWFYRALGAIHCKKWYTAKTFLLELLRSNPEHASALNNLALVLYINNDKAAAVAALHKALSLNPNYLDAKANLNLLQSNPTVNAEQFKWSNRILRPVLLHYQG